MRTGQTTQRTRPSPKRSALRCRGRGRLRRRSGRPRLAQDLQASSTPSRPSSTRRERSRACSRTEIEQLHRARSTSSRARSRRFATARRSSRRELDRSRPSSIASASTSSVLRERLRQLDRRARGAPRRDLQVRRARRAHGDPRVRRLRGPAGALRVPEADRGSRTPPDRRPRPRRCATRPRSTSSGSARRATRSPPRGASSTRTRVELEASEAELDAARAGRKDAASRRSRTTSSGSRATSATSRARSRQQLQAPAAAAGPPRRARSRASSGGLIWPVNGPVTSPFGMALGPHARGHRHRGARRARRSAPRNGGVVALAAPTGGYGNYTCIDHGGGLSTCYAHQSRFADRPPARSARAR